MGMMRNIHEEEDNMSDCGCGPVCKLKGNPMYTLDGIEYGRPIVGSVWESNREINSGRGKERFRIDGHGNTIEDLSCWRDNAWRSGHAWPISDIVENWKLISLTDKIVKSPSPVAEEERKDGCICIFGRSRFCTAH